MPEKVEGVKGRLVLAFTVFALLLTAHSLSSYELRLTCELIRCKAGGVAKKCSCSEVNASDDVYATKNRLEFNHTPAEIEFRFGADIPGDAILRRVVLATEWRVEDDEEVGDVCRISVWKPFEQEVSDECVYEERLYNYTLPDMNVSQLERLVIKMKFENTNHRSRRVRVDHAYVKVEYELPVELVANVTGAILINGVECTDACSLSLTPHENHTLVIEAEDVRARLRDVSLTRAAHMDIQWFRNYTGYRPGYVNLTTALFALNDTDLTYAGAELYFEKFGATNKILHCTDWDFPAAQCNAWRVDNLDVYQAKQNATHLWFGIPHFTAFAGGAGYDANLIIWDDTDPEGGLSRRLKGESVKFFANYSNVTTGQPINATTDYCEASFNVSGSWTQWQNMSFNVTSSLYEYAYVFGDAGIWRWNVTCHSLAYDDLNASDTVFISVRVPTACVDSDGDCDYTNLYADDEVTEEVNLRTDPYGWINVTAWNWDLPDWLILSSTLHVMWWSDTGLGAGNIYLDYWNSTHWVTCAGPFGEQAEEIEIVCDISHLTVGQQNQLMVRFRGEDLDLALPAFAYVDFIYVKADVDLAPYWLDNVTSPPSPTTYSQGASYTFNITWRDNVNVSDVVFEFETNYSYLATQVSRDGDIFFKTLVDLAAGSYSYRWYANDTVDLWNVTPAWTYEVDKAASAIQVTISPASTVTYPTTTTATCSIVDGDPAATLSIYRNGTLVAQGAGTQSETILLGGGVYNYTCVYIESQNYTSSVSLDNFLTVQPGPTEISLYLNGTRGDRTYLRGQIANLTATLNVSDKTIGLWANFTGIEQLIDSATDRVENITSTAGLLGPYLVKANWTGDQNYTADEELWILTVIMLEVNLIEPPPNLQAPQNVSFRINASITCRGGPCGDVSGQARYNATSPTPDASIPVGSGTPFYIISPPSNPLACPTNPLDANEWCNVSWEVNATGPIDSTWKIDVFFASNLIVGGNDTVDARILIVCPVYLVLQFDLIDFGSVDPLSTVAAVGNDAKLYNITITQQTGCNVDLWIRGTDLTLEGDGYYIGVANMTWNLTAVYPGHSLDHAYQLVSSGIEPHTNVTTYYWLDTPGGILAGKYSGTVYYMANETSS